MKQTRKERVVHQQFTLSINVDGGTEEGQVFRKRLDDFIAECDGVTLVEIEQHESADEALIKDVPLHDNFHDNWMIHRRLQALLGRYHVRRVPELASRTEAQIRHMLEGDEQLLEHCRRILERFRLKFHRCSS